MSTQYEGSEATFINKYNLINAQSGPPQYVNENTLLYTLAYDLYTGDKQYRNAMLYYAMKLRHSKEIKGLYNNLTTLSSWGRDNYTSPDQLISIVALNNLYEHNDNKEIWGYLWKHLFTYDNLKPNKINFDRVMQPMAILTSAVGAGIWLLKPLLSLVCIISCLPMPERSSGAQKAFVVASSFRMKLTLSICKYIVKGWDKVWAIYYPDKTHPIRSYYEHLKLYK